ncbi:hypothetical protein ACHAP5_012148 [Fusarium lateritium]
MTGYSDIIATHGSISQPESILDWMEHVDSAMCSMESSLSKQTKKQKPTDKVPSKDSEFDGLLRRYQVLRNETETVENEIVRVYYESLHNESASSFASPEAHGSISTGQSISGCGLVDAIQDPRHKDSQLTIDSLVDLHFDEPHAPTKADKHAKKRRKHMKFLSEEEKGRNINKVFIQQNPF